MAKHNRNCIWECGRETNNISRICDHCWKAAELLRSNTDAGYKAWCERKQAQQVKEAEAKAKKPMSEKQRGALDAARRAKLLKQLPVAELST
jgi:predicted amidophosphoribosyltransferase